MTLLLHACCGPCLGGSWAGLKKADPEFQATLLWDNPNIHPYLEYRERHGSFLIMAAKLGLAVVGNEPRYGLVEFLRVLGQEFGPARCRLCFDLRLGATARRARELGCEAFSTTLLISPYQDHELLAQTGREVGNRHGVPFRYLDLRPFFKGTYEAARTHGLYRQKYCGCIFSEQERFEGDQRFRLAQTGDAPLTPPSRERF
jgi:hypothetical protein